MNKTIIKTVILIAFIALSVTGVLIWQKTVVQPPTHFESENNHKKDLSASISQITADNAEKMYDECNYKLRRYKKENLIDSVESSAQLEKLVDAYVPHFINRCDNAFSASVWNKDDWSHAFMRSRINDLKQLKKHDGTPAIGNSSQQMDALNRVAKVMKDYDNAWAAANNTKFVSVENTKIRLQSANSYKSHPQLQNCVALKNALSALPQKIKNSHYGYLKGLSNNLSCRGVDWIPSFVTSENTINKKIDDYNNFYSTNEANSIKASMRSKYYDYLRKYANAALNVYNSSDWDDYLRRVDKVYGYVANDQDSRGAAIRSTISNNMLDSEDSYNNSRYGL